MPVTQFPVHPVVAERIRRVLSACQYARTADDYSWRLVTALAKEMRSEYAIWLDWPIKQSESVAQTAKCEIVLDGLRSLFDGAPILSCALDSRSGVESIAAAPMMFRRSIAGVLAVANRDEGYVPEDLEVLAEIGQVAVADYEGLRRAEMLGVGSARQWIADFVHEIRQPLGILEACACYLDMVLPIDQIKARAQLVEMQKQLDSASRMLEERTASYLRPSERPKFEEAASGPEDESSRVLTNSAISLVT